MAKSFNEVEVLDALVALRSFELPDDGLILSLRQNPNRLLKLMTNIEQTVEYLGKMQELLDSTFSPAFTFNLNDPRVLGEVIVIKLEQEPKTALDSLTPFYGSGVYAIYYQGPFPAYEAITNTNCPIYVGKASPADPGASGPKGQGLTLYKRLNEHRGKSIGKAKNLDVKHFSCRYMVTQSGLEKAAEDFLIQRYLPVWNEEAKVCSGLGKHGDKVRAEKSSWDILHPGRPWAENQSSRSGETPKSITQNIQAHFNRQMTKTSGLWESIFNPGWIEKVRES